jgi:hypothetical protein
MSFTRFLHIAALTALMLAAMEAGSMAADFGVGDWIVAFIKFVGQ